MIPMNLNKSALEEIQKSQGATLPFIIKDLIKANEIPKQHMLTLWSEYLGNVPIKNGSNDTNPARPQNRLAHDFRSTIVQQAVGYMFGNPIDISYPIEDTTAQELISKFLKKNYYSKADAELASYLGVCGKAFRLVYYDANTNLIFKNIKPFEAIVINDSTVDEPACGLIYYNMEFPNSSKKIRTKVEFYDNLNVYYFIESENGNYVADTTYGDAVQNHGFTFVPLIQINNNATSTGDFERVRTLVDAYDKLISFGITDHESWSNAYLLFYGVEPTKETIEYARKTGAFYVPRDSDMDANNKVEFLTKEINTANIKDLADRLNNDIYRFSNSVDFSDEKFGGQQSGEARKYKLIGLENKCKEKERYFTIGYQYLFKVAASFWQMVKGVNISAEEIQFTFTRNLPVDITIDNLIGLQQAGILSTETAIKQLPFIEDSEDEYEKVLKEKELYGSTVNLDNEPVEENVE